MKKTTSKKILASEHLNMFVTSKEIYSATNGGLDVILHYFPQAADSVENRSKKFRIQSTDKIASASLKQIEGGIWTVTDFGGDQIPRNCIEITRKQENCDFKEAITFIAKRFNIVPHDNKKMTEMHAAEIREVQKKYFQDEFPIEKLLDEIMLAAQKGESLVIISVPMRFLATKNELEALGYDVRETGPGSTKISW